MADSSTTTDDMMTIEDYLRGATAYEVPDNAINRILLKRSLVSGTPASLLTEKDLDLATADLYMWCASTPSVKNNSSDSDGDWSHTEGGWQTSAYDKRQLREMAKDLYAKWDETVTATSKIKIVNL